MKKLLLALAMCLPVSILAYGESKTPPPAHLSLYVFEQNTAVEDFQVWMDPGIELTSIKDGSAQFTLTPGEHQLNINRSGFNEARVNLNVQAGETLQVIITQYPGNPVSHVALETSSSTMAGAHKKNNNAIVKGEPGTLKGRIVNSENGEPIKNARIFFSGFSGDFISNEQGKFTAKVPAANYSLSILHPGFATQTLDNIKISAHKTLNQSFEITPAGLALKEFVVVAPFIQGSVSSLVDERKQASVMSDFVGSEQMAKSGDSDAAAALTRVAGLTLIDGKYAVIRGMGDRYTQVLMNGAVMRSPDPSSQSVNLDLFPASILDSIEVQKTYSSDVPGAFGGGVIKLRTKALPEEDFFKVKVSSGGNSQVTGKGVISQQSSGSDYLGMDDGLRDLPVTSEPFKNLSDERAKLFELRYQTKQQTARPNLGVSASFGQLFDVMGMDAGYQSYLSYNNKWSYQQGEQFSYGAGGGKLILNDDVDYESSKYSVNVTGLLNAGIESEHHELKSTTALIRKSHRITRVEEGKDSEADLYIRETELEWSERELFSQQFNAKHRLSQQLTVDWLLGFSSASLDTPDRISYSYDDEISQDINNLYFSKNQTERSFLTLNDDSSNLGFNLSWKIEPYSFVKINAKAGYSFDTTERESQEKIYKAVWHNASNPPQDIISSANPNEVLSHDNIRDDGFIYKDLTPPSASFNATSETTAVYSLLETTWFDDLDVVLGARNESFSQQVHTFDFTSGEAIDIDQTTDNLLPSILATYRFTGAIQARFAMATTVNRPSMLELSSSRWHDPDSGDILQGNPRLTEATIDHFDARVEFYGAGANSVSLAYFNKSFDAPIERTLLPSVDKVISFQNADSADNSGFEVDFRWDLDFIPTGNYIWGMSGNYSVIDSNVVLTAGHSEFSNTRAMQGQSPYTMNLMLTLDNDEYGVESALVVNEIGERISQVSTGDVPHVFEQPFTALDFTLSKSLDRGKFSLKLKNILDSERLYLQGSETYKRSKPGIDFSMSYSASL